MDNESTIFNLRQYWLGLRGQVTALALGLILGGIVGYLCIVWNLPDWAPLLITIAIGLTVMLFGLSRVQKTLAGIGPGVKLKLVEVQEGEDGT